MTISSSPNWFYAMTGARRRALRALDDWPGPRRHRPGSMVDRWAFSRAGKDADRIAVERALAELRAGSAGRDRGWRIRRGGDRGRGAGRTRWSARSSRSRSAKARLLLPMRRACVGLGSSVKSPARWLCRASTSPASAHWRSTVDARIDAPVAHLATARRRGARTRPSGADRAGRRRPADGRGASRATRDWPRWRRRPSSPIARRACRDLRIVTRGPAPLEGASEAEFVVFRGGDGHA